MTKKKLTYITILGACIAAGVFVTVPSQAVSDEGKSKAMIMLEKAKAANFTKQYEGLIIDINDIGFGIYFF